MEDPQFTVALAGVSPRGAARLKAVRRVTGLSLWHSGQVLDSGTATLLADVPFELAEAAARELRRVGVAVAVRCGACRRTLPEDGASVEPGPCAGRYFPTAHCQANSLTSCDCSYCVEYGPLPGHSER
ncbi:ribosomal protein L7/L12 [Kitasatospora sp. NPDC089797]|uniref:ribosomal protein L7/L12 n=1 Tax=Kitasatospora sp. NPDC089797 TaxID=3155298 RepID=UPI00342E4152